MPMPQATPVQPSTPSMSKNRAAPGSTMPPEMQDGLIQVDQVLMRLIDETKERHDVHQAFQDALASFRKAANALNEATDPKLPRTPENNFGRGGVMTMEQGGNGGAMPMTHQAAAPAAPRR